MLKDEIEKKTQFKKKRKNYLSQPVLTLKLIATQFLTHVLIIFRKNPKIVKSIENPKKYVFNTFASFLAFFSVV